MAAWFFVRTPCSPCERCRRARQIRRARFSSPCRRCDIDQRQAARDDQPGQGLLRGAGRIKRPPVQPGQPNCPPGPGLAAPAAFITPLPRQFGQDDRGPGRPPGQVGKGERGKGVGDGKGRAHNDWESLLKACQAPPHRLKRRNRILGPICKQLQPSGLRAWTASRTELEAPSPKKRTRAASRKWDPCRPGWWIHRSCRTESHPQITQINTDSVRSRARDNGGPSRVWFSPIGPPRKSAVRHPVFKAVILPEVRTGDDKSAMLPESETKPLRQAAA